MARIPTPVASFKTTITAQISASATSVQIDKVLDDAGNSLDGKVLAFCIDKGLPTEETVLGTVDGAGMQITGLTRGLDPQDGATSRAALKFIHRKKASIEITAHPYLILLARALNGEDAIDATYRPKLSADTDASANEQLVTAGQLARTALGTATTSKTIIPGTAGETLVDRDHIYLKASDGRWWKVDADTAATVDNIELGVAMGAGTAGNLITGGVQLPKGLVTGMTGLTANTKYYYSNTAGGISTTPGTVEVTAGFALSTTTFLLAPRYDQQITEDIQDALGGTSGSPSASNKFITDDDSAGSGPVLRSTLIFGSGADGDVTIAAPTTLTSDKYYNNLTLNSTLDADGYRVFVKGILTVNAGGLISNNGGAGGAGGNGSGGVGGAAGAAGAAAPGNTLPSGLAGKAGGLGADRSAGVGASNGAAGTAGDSLSPSLASSNGAAAGAGGDASSAGGAATGGAAGGAGTATQTLALPKDTHRASSLIQVAGSAVTILRPSAGSGSGGSGGASKNAGGAVAAGGGGGGSGASGGIVWVAARSIVLNDGVNTWIQAKGGAGGAGGNGQGSGGEAGGGGGAGGAGGNGGVIIYIYASLTGSMVTDVTGGALGAGGTAQAQAPATATNGANGSAGNAGVVFAINLDA